MSTADYTITVVAPDSVNLEGFYVSVKNKRGREVVGDGYYVTADEAKDALLLMLVDENETLRAKAGDLASKLERLVRDLKRLAGES